MFWFLFSLLLWIKTLIGKYLAIIIFLRTLFWPQAQRIVSLSFFFFLLFFEKQILCQMYSCEFSPILWPSSLPSWRSPATLPNSTLICFVVVVDWGRETKNMLLVLARRGGSGRTSWSGKNMLKTKYVKKFKNSKICN